MGKIKFYFNVGEMLEKHGMNTYKAKTSGMFSQSVLRKLKDEDEPNITIETLAKICEICDLQPKDIIYYSDED